MDGSSPDTRTARITAEEALALHAEGRPGKLAVQLTKPLTTARAPVSRRKAALRCPAACCPAQIAGVA